MNGKVQKQTNQAAQLCLRMTQKTPRGCGDKNSSPPITKKYMYNLQKNNQ